MKMEDLFHEAARRHASDIHLAVHHPPMLRIGGRLVKLNSAPLEPKTIEALARSLLNERQWKRFQTSRELDFAFEEKKNRFRVNLHMERGHLALAARIIGAGIPTFKEIGLPDVVHQLIGDRNGLIIVTGPAGSGKSTTLAAMIQMLNETKPYHIVTLEDPIEFVFPPALGLVKQREIGSDTASFSEGLRHALRQDPDILMVGEMRDPETIAAALTLAETGHLVLSTLHTRTAASTVSRIVDAFPGDQQEQVRFQLALALRGVIAQTLLPRPKTGLVAAREVLINTPAVSNLIRTNNIEQIANVIQTGKRQGMFTMAQDIQRLVKEGSISDIVATESLSVLGLARI